MSVKMKTSRKCAFAAIFTALVLAASVFGMTARAEETTPDAQVNVGGIVFDTNDFNYTEDYAAFVDTARVVNNGNESVLYDPDRREQKTRLDDGKSGLYLETKKTGDEADGSSFTFANKMKGNFDIDFRVFSKETYVGSTKVKAMGKDGKNNFTSLDPNFNPYADVRVLTYTFTSVKDTSKSFTVVFESHGSYETMSPTAHVYIESEPVLGDGRRGYGIDYSFGGKHGDGYANFTELNNTSFVNVAFKNSAESFSNRLIFDPETMRVYSDKYALDKCDDNGMQFRSYETGYNDYRLLIRDLATNKDNNNKLVDRAWVNSLQPADFEDGYTVTVTMEDITADDTVLKAATSDAADAQNPVVYKDDVKVKKTGDAYNRTGKMIIYSVNGQSMRVDEGFNAPTEKTFTFPKNDKTPYSEKAVKGLQFTAKEKNINAEGNSFELNPDEFLQGNVFTMMIAPEATKYGSTTATEHESHYTKTGNGGLGDKSCEYDPYSDVREIGVTFRSKSDASKAFTVYISSKFTFRNKVGARVYVEGEEYRTASGMKGYGGDMVQVAAGSFGNGHNGSNDSYNDATGNPYTMVQFDVANVLVKTYAYGSETVRDLTKKGKWNATWEHSQALAASDFSSGYTVTVSVERMNRAENLGLKNVYMYNKETRETWDTGYTEASDGTHVLSESYDRPCKINVLRYEGNTTIANTEISNYGAKTKYDGGREYLDIGDTFSYAYDGTAIELPVKLGNLGAGKAIDTVNYKHASDGNTAALTVTDGTAQFNPTKSGVYTFSSGALTAKLTVTAATPLSASLKSGVPESTRLPHGGTLPAVSQDDIETAGSFSRTTAITYKKKLATDPDTSYIDTAYTAGAVADEDYIYKIIYTVTDTDGQTATVERQVVAAVTDDEAPAIEWKNKPEYLEAGSVWTTAVLTVTDNIETGLVASVDSASFKPAGGDAENLTYDAGLTIPDKDGVLTIVVSASDTVPNTATETYTIDVYTGAAPTIALKEGVESSVNATEGDDFTVAITDVVVSSNWENTVTFAVRLNGGAYTYEDGQTLTVGLYEITYTVTDKFGTSASVTRQIAAVAKDVTAPVIAWKNKPAYILGGTTFTLDDITAQDDVDDSVAVVFVSASFTPAGGDARALTFDNGIVLPTEDGVLTIAVSATDSTGNKADKEFTVAILKEQLSDNDDNNGGEKVGTGCGSSVDAALSAAIALLLGAATALFAKRH